MGQRIATSLRYVLIAKIGLTLLLWGPPLLLAPNSWLQWLGFPPLEPALFRRLLGAAYVALVFGYSGGVRDIARGRWPGATIAMGIVSNGVAAALITAAIATGAMAGWGAWAYGYMLMSAVTTAVITLALSVVAVRAGMAAVAPE